MPETSWLTLLASSIGGGVVVKVLDYVRDEYQRRRERTETARELLTRHQDPILKTADELVGEIRSLALSDFAVFRTHQHQPIENVSFDLRRLSALFYFAQFWARVQLLRVESGSIALASDPAGARLQKFLQQLESRAVRVVDRVWQRAAGEAIIVTEGSGRRPMNVYEFSDRYHTQENFRKWFRPLALLLDNSGRQVADRQRVLKYGVVLHALIDTLDAAHIVTVRRDPWPHKLSSAVRKQLAFGTFSQHLPFVPKWGAYTKAQKKGGPSGRGVHPPSE